jgi:hypothetical protein
MRGSKSHRISDLDLQHWKTYFIKEKVRFTDLPMFIYCTASRSLYVLTAFVAPIAPLYYFHMHHSAVSLATRKRIGGLPYESLFAETRTFFVSVFQLPERLHFYQDGPVSMFPSYEYLHQCVPTCILVAHIFIPVRRCLIVPSTR